MIIRCQASTKSSASPLDRLATVSGSWLKVNHTGSPMARTRSIHATIWVWTDDPTTASAIDRQEITVPSVLRARTDRSIPRSLSVTVSWKALGNVEFHRSNTRTKSSSRPIWSSSVFRAVVRSGV